MMGYLTTSMITPPFNIWANPALTAKVPTLELEWPLSRGRDGVCPPSPVGVWISDPERKSLFGMAVRASLVASIQI
jgi:hypothetical protein